MIHGLPPLSAALTACVLVWGSACHHIEREPLHPIYRLAHVRFEMLVKALLRFLIPLLVTLAQVTYVLRLALWLPGLFGLGK
jgi:hypothetical protein